MSKVNQNRTIKAQILRLIKDYDIDEQMEALKEAYTDCNIQCDNMRKAERDEFLRCEFMHEAQTLKQSIRAMDMLKDRFSEYFMSQNYDFNELTRETQMFKTHINKFLENNKL